MKQFLKDFAQAFLIGLLIFLILSIVLYYRGISRTNPEILEEFIYNQILSLALYFANNLVYRYNVKKYKSNFLKPTNLLFGAIESVFVTLLTIFLVNLLITVGYNGVDFENFIENQQLQFYITAFIISAVITTIFYLVYYWKSKQERKVQQQKIIAGSASAQFDALKNQLDPHFLFNSLNVLTSLIEENPLQAQKFTTSLSKVYRYVLEQKSKELITVDEELAFAKTYINLIKMRFEDSIVFTAPERSSNPEAKVVPLSLQLVLENAVKHNLVTPKNKLHITIYEEDAMLVVANNKQLKTVVKKSSGVGLQNIRQRYYLLSDRAVEIEDEADTFKVALPMLTVAVKPAYDVQKKYIEDKRYKLAKNRLEKIKGFYAHLTVYLIFVPIFIILNLKSTTFPWALFPIGGWGIGVLSHASETFEWRLIFNKDWEARKIKELMDDESF